MFQETIWALLPSVVAISLALFTKEVYSSLFVGIVTGGLLYAGFNPIAAFDHLYKNGFIAVIADPYNAGILIFLVILGIIVALMNSAGGSAAFGEFAKAKIKSKTGAQILTIIFGMMIFIDDYFNCLTVGSIMRPVSDKHKISRAKLAYLIDATAAPICIIAPISSWAAAVAGFVEGEDGFTIFLRAIPYNYYAILTIVMLFTISILKLDFGPMLKHEINAQNGDLTSSSSSAASSDISLPVNEKGRVIDLIFPVITLIVFCVIGMLYSGGFFNAAENPGLVTAFSNSDASVGLAMGSLTALIITIIFYLKRGVLNFKQCMDSIPEGFKQMVPAILILVFAWSLKAMTDSLGAKEFVAGVIAGSAQGLVNFLPAIIFIVGCFLAFATGTSWGTFGILIPIVVAIFQNSDPTLMIISISACMAGAVCGDHCSPISDTTIMASAGAQCNHINHVNTQLPYAMLCAVISFITYIIAGFTRTPWIALPLGILITVAILYSIKYSFKYNNTQTGYDKGTENDN
ncbi:MAG: Na+/H+ antiporter NhaC family protein [Lachnospiraceae bacterium]|nr:Na+/H+ antiporter NhaC family protein [Lachnospiraceae bacterium]